MTIRLNTPLYGKIRSQFKEIQSILRQLKQIQENDEIRFDFAQIYFIHPTFILALRTIIDDLIKSGTKVTLINFQHRAIGNYLSHIYFKKTFKPDLERNWEDSINYYRSRTYIPIISFPSTNDDEKTEIRENTISCLNDILKDSCRLSSDLQMGVSYIISEITDNIVEHSNTDRGWICAQFYPSKGYIDICIIDKGIGLLESYRTNNFNEIITDSDAIEKALEGLSTKNQVERGYGIRTSKSVSVNGLNGLFTILSGNAIYYDNKQYSFGVEWKGTLVSMRIYNNIDNFSVYNYIEG